MKSTLTSAQTNQNVVGASVVSRDPISPPDNSGSPASCPASYSCPENDGCQYTGGDGRTFALKCNADYYGGDFANMNSDSLQSCNKACADNAQCVAASYVGGKGAGHCYLKGTNNGASGSDNVDGFAIDTRVPATSTISSSSSSTPVSTTSAIVSSASSTDSSSSVTSPSSASSSTPSPTPTPSSTTPTPTPTPTKPTGPQLLVNPSFEDGSGIAASPWTPNPTRNSASTAGRVASDMHSGQYSYKVSSSNGGYFTYWLEQPVTVVPGQAYDVSLWAKATSDMASCYVLTYLNSARPATPVLTPTGEYKQFTVTYPSSFFKQTAYTFTAVISCSGARAGGTVWLDDVTMTQVVQ
ncbi:hypothetical protein G6514_009373 [Epicoccum nigrum]|nr:hypothetical protein G6514_009373 [Epicoccum nigrum]